MYECDNCGNEVCEECNLKNDNSIQTCGCFCGCDESRCNNCGGIHACTQEGCSKFRCANCENYTSCSNMLCTTEVCSDCTTFYLFEQCFLCESEYCNHCYADCSLCSNIVCIDCSINHNKDNICKECFAEMTVE